MKPDLRPLLGRTVTVTVDRPLGSAHPRHPDIIYPVNYGFLSGVTGGDGEEQDVYILGVDAPLKHFTGTVIAIVRRANDDEDKLVAAPAGRQFSEAEIEAALWFQEQYFSHTIEILAMSERPVNSLRRALRRATSLGEGGSGNREP